MARKSRGGSTPLSRTSEPPPRRGFVVRSPGESDYPREDLGVTLGEPLDRDVGSPTALRNREVINAKCARWQSGPRAA